MISINPYLNFPGTCEAAFNHYQKVFGGEFQSVNRFSEMPADPRFPVAEVDKHKIMHISLPISEGNVLMGSDTIQANQAKLISGTNFQVSISLDDTAEAERIFNTLAEGGTIQMPLEKTFWEAYFGMLTDAYGIQWMINCSTVS